MRTRLAAGFWLFRLFTHRHRHTRATKSFRVGAKPPNDLRGFSATFNPSTNTLLFIGGQRGGERTFAVYVLVDPRNPKACFGAPHPANPRVAEALQKLIANARPATMPIQKHIFRVCDCFRLPSMFDMTDASESLVPHHSAISINATVDELVELSDHAAVSNGVATFCFGGKTTKGRFFDGVVEARGSIEAKTSVFSRMYGSTEAKFHLFKSAIKVTKHDVDLRAYVPTLGCAAASWLDSAYLIGGRAQGGVTINNIFEFNMRTREMLEWRPNIGRLPPLAYASAVPVRGQILVFGGESSDGSLLNSLFIINLMAKSIDRVVLGGVQPTPRAHHWAAMLGPHMAIGGGIGEKNDLVLLRNAADLKLVVSPFSQSMTIHQSRLTFTP